MRLLATAMLSATLALTASSLGVVPAGALDEPPPTCDGMPANIIGTPDHDRLTGTDGDDVIVAGAGRDEVLAGAGNDVVCAGPGSDRITGGSGHDRLFGEGANDLFSETTGNDLIVGGAGNYNQVGYLEAPSGVAVRLAEGTVAPMTDALTGPGHDQLSDIRGVLGTPYDDLLVGTEGKDRIFGLGGRDEIRGDDARDRIGIHDGVVRAGRGKDIVFATGGDTNIRLGDGRDRITGGDGDQVIDGGPGRDHVVVRHGRHLDSGPLTGRLRGGGGRDLLELEVRADVHLSLADGVARWSDARVDLGSLERVRSRGGGDDVLEGSSRAEEIDGGFGDDVIRGLGGDDLLIGRADRDEVYGGAGRDTCDGERRFACERRWIFSNS